MQTGGLINKQSEETKRKISDGLLNAVRERSDNNKDLPQHIRYYIRKSTKVHTHGYKVNYPPAKKEKQFMININKELTIEMLNKAKEFLKETIDNHKKLKENKDAIIEESKIKSFTFKQNIKANGLPVYISYYIDKRSNKKHGYRIDFKPNRKHLWLLLIKN